MILVVATTHLPHRRVFGRHHSYDFGMFEV
jgi:hypothetical protein